MDAYDSHKRLEVIIRLMDKVYGDDPYTYEYVEKLERLYGKEAFKTEFIKIPGEDNFHMKSRYELTESPEKVKEISETRYRLIEESKKKQKRATKLLWDLVDHNIEKMWD
jgi:hypothetical protein